MIIVILSMADVHILLIAPFPFSYVMLTRFKSSRDLTVKLN